MPDSGSASIRLHCICGQKMKISESMYGLPGKCTACRQKIRLPRADELPEDCSDIHLSEHPEFLRGTKMVKDGLPTSHAKHVDDAPTPVTELDMSDSAESSRKHMAGSVPLDPLPSLQTLASLQLRIERKIQIIDKEKTPDPKRRKELKARLTRARGLRKSLDEQIHQSLMEVAIKLTVTQEEIADLQLSARVDEVPFKEFLDKVYALRVRRDHLERQQLNLRGWLATVGPSAVGGYRDVTIDELPKEGFTLNVQMDSDAVDSLLSAHASGLKQAFSMRKRAARKMKEIKKTRKSSTPEGRARLKDPYALEKASKAIAAMHIGFFQQRIKLLIQDQEGDIETLDAQIATARDQLSMDQLERSEYDRLKSSAGDAKWDLNRGCELAQQLLLAKSSSEVIDPENDYKKSASKASASTQSEAGTPPYLLWGSTALWAMSIILPVTSEGSLLSAFRGFGNLEGVVGLILALPILYAVLTFSLIFVTQRAVQSLGGLLLWGTSIVFMAYCVNESQYSLDPLAERFRMGSAWLLRPGIIAMLGASTLAFIHAVLALKDSRALRPWAVVSVVMTILLTTWFGLNGLGTFRVDPEFALEVVTSKTSSVGKLMIGNRGMRTVYLVDGDAGIRNAYVCTVTSADGKVLALEGMGKKQSIDPGANVMIPLRFPPGEYQLSLKPGGNGVAWSSLFTIKDVVETIQPVVAPEPVTQDEDIKEEPSVTMPVVPAPIEEEPAPEAPPLPTVKLKGVITGSDGSVQFLIELVPYPTASDISLRVRMKEEIMNGWVVSEYNTRGILTLRRDKAILMLRRGAVVALPALDEAPAE